MANGPAHGGHPPPRPSKLTGSSPSERERRIKEGSEPSLPGGGTYFLGRYRIVDEIGVGGMASVHLARADGPGGFQKWVAIKRIHRHLAEDETFIRMFLDEARIAARISHPNVAQVFDLGKHKDTYWIAMEYLHGEPLREVVRAVEEGGAPLMTPQLAAKIIADSAEGLHAAHELRDKNGKLLNLVHRDVTPHNLFLTYDGAVKVVDFGIAKVTGRLSNTRAGTLKGKLAYMSPEQVRGAQVDRRTDIFALGVVLWELTTGRRLFRMESDLETLERVQACVVPPPSTVVENYPVELEAIVMRALAKDLNRRYPTAREMSRALQQYLMKAGSFMGSDEIGGYVKHVLSERFEKREAHLQWAAEVTQTISLEQLDGGPRELEEVSILTYASDVQEVPKRTGPRPAAGAAPLPAAGRPKSATPPPRSQSEGARPVPPRSAPRPAAGKLPSYDLNSATGTDSDLLEPLDEDDELAKTTVASPLVKDGASSRRQPTALGLGPPSQKSGAGPPLPSYEITSSANPGASVAMHDYSEEDDDAVTRVMASPMDEPDAAVSAVHAPAKSVQPAPQPRENIVVSPSAMTHDMPQYSPAPPQVGMQGMPPGMMQQGMYSMPPSMAPGMGYGPQQAPQAQGQSSRSVLITVIAAATTLIALALMALVVLKVTEAPAPTAATAPATTTQPTAQPVAQTATAPTPQPTAAQPTATATQAAPEQAVDPSTLPTEPKKTATVSHSYASHPAPSPPSHQTSSASGSSGSSAPGFLTVVCDPACDSVVAAGHSLGPSPVVRASLKPGTHAVLLRRSGSPSQSISVTIVSGQTTARRVKMGS